MKLLKVRLRGSVNSFRQPDFHTYHKTLPLPPKTTIAGMIGSALGLSPPHINEEWLKSGRFQCGIVGKSYGKASDLWQIRKYEGKQIAAFEKGEQKHPYKTAVIVRELLFNSQFTLYFSFAADQDYEAIANALANPKWALSLGREDELVEILSCQTIHAEERENGVLRNTYIANNINTVPYQFLFNAEQNENLLNQAPTITKLPTEFSYEEGTDIRRATVYQEFSFIHDLPVEVQQPCYHDAELGFSFQLV